jgi:hypothetical protein
MGVAALARNLDEVTDRPFVESRWQPVGVWAPPYTLARDLAIGCAWVPGARRTQFGIFAARKRLAFLSGANCCVRSNMRARARR